MNDNQKEYVGQDGLLYCAICHRAVQKKIIMPFLNTEKIVHCICDCDKKEMILRKEQEKSEERKRKRLICFEATATQSNHHSNMLHWTFANDNRRNPNVSDAMQKYVLNFEEFKRDGKGILLCGDVGVGKSYMAACVANALIDKDYSVLMTNFTRIVNRIQEDFKGRQEYIDSLSKYTLLVIDDLGIERQSDYMQEMIYNIVDSRWRSGLPFFVTTNLTPNELKKPENIGHKRIYERIIERCFLIKMEGVSQRRLNVRDDYAEMKLKLGL